MKEMKDILEFSKRSDIITEEFLKNLQECTTYGSIGTLNWVIDVLQILKERIENGQKIKLEKNNEYLTIEILKKIIGEYFVDYIVKGVFKTTILKNKVYFKLENTKEGMDLVYTGDTPNKLFKWIADLNEEQCLMRLLPTNVVYIRNNKNNTYIPFLTEHNSCYVYDKNDGKIKEYFE